MKLFKNIGAALALTIILFAGCKNPAEDVQLVINTDIFKSPTLIQFVNAKKGAESPKDFTVTIEGPNKDLVRTTTGGKTFKATDGLLNLVLDRSANPSVTNPVKFTVIANPSGFAPVFQDVTITSATDPVLVRVAVAEYANPAVGASATVDTKALNNGTTSTDVTIVTPTNAGITQQTNITVPSGTGFSDAAGAPIVGGQLESRVLFNGTATNGTTPNAPGGNFASNVIGSNGQKIASGVNFLSAGSVSIDMYIGGKEVKTFSKPVIVDMEVNPAMINPTTGVAIKAGETIPMWSLNDETGQWKSEGNATLLNSSGKLVARMAISHLSPWMTAFSYIVSDPRPIVSPYCSSTVVINKPASQVSETFSINIPGALSFYTIVYFAPGETSKSTTIETFRYGVGAITVQPGVGFSPYLGPYSESFASSPTYVNNTLTSSLITDFCGKTTTFTFVAPPPAEVIDVDVYVKVKCGGKDLITGINANITITPIGGTSDDSRVYNLNQGRGSGQIVNGTKYKIVASVDGKSYTSEFTATKDNFQLPAGFDLTGTAIFTNGRLKIEGQVTKSDCN